jgi:hypothetical protein
MSALPLQSRTKPTVQELATAAAAQRAADAAECSYSNRPFYFARFRSALLRLTKEYFATPGNLPVEEDIPTMPCLAGDAVDPTKTGIHVRSTFDVDPPSTEETCIFIRMPELKFEKLFLGDYGGSSANLSSTYREKSFKGTLVFLADNPVHDVAVTLLEGLLVYLEGTKHNWMTTLGLTSFDVVSLGEGVETRKAPQRMLRATLTVEFTGRQNIDAYQEALPLKRIVLTTNPA